MENPIRIDDFGGTTRGITILGNLHMRHASSLIVIIVILLLVICPWRLHGSHGIPEIFSGVTLVGFSRSSSPDFSKQGPIMSHRWPWPIPVASGPNESLGRSHHPQPGQGRAMGRGGLSSVEPNRPVASPRNALSSQVSWLFNRKRSWFSFVRRRILSKLVYRSL
jgi:hypothetical protein